MSELNIEPSIEGLRQARNRIYKLLVKEQHRTLSLRDRIKDLLSEIENLKLELDSLQNGTIQP